MKQYLKDYGYTKISLNRVDGRFFVKKELTHREGDFLKLFENEKYFSTKLIHKNIISCFETGDDFLILEYAEYKDLFSIISKMPYMIKEFKDKWILELISGLSFIHSHNIVHNDLKTSNLFITKDKTLKIGDFGLTQYEGSDFFKQLNIPIFQGTYSINKTNSLSMTPDKKSDLYALAVILFEIFTFKNPQFTDVTPSLIEDPVISELVSLLLKGKIRTVKELYFYFIK
ncbi:protein kinase family protein [bacterium]|nr:protein kinase family protein [bacterium]